MSKFDVLNPAQALDSFSAWARDVARGFIENGRDECDDDDDVKHSIRAPIIFVIMAMFFYKAAVPLISSKKSVYMDLRLGTLVWLFIAAVLHTPLGSAQVEDHPSMLFVSVFVLLLVVTHSTLAAFTVLHHLFAGLLWLIAPNSAEMLWAPALRSVRSFRAILKSSIVLSGILSLVFSYCSTLAINGWSPSESEQLDVMQVCQVLLPRLDNIGLDIGANRFLNFRIFGFEIGRLSLLKSPIGLLWLSFVALWATYYTVRRTKRIDQSLQERAKRKLEMNPKLGKKNSSELAQDDDGYDSEDEYFEEDMAKSGSRKMEKSPEQFMPMAEWYSLQVSETAFQLLISMKLFLGRFDMRTMQAAIDCDDDSSVSSSDSEESYDGFVDGYETAKNSRSDRSSSRSRSRSRSRTRSVKSTCGRNGTKRSSRIAQAPKKGRGARSEKSRGPHFDKRYANLDSMWFDWMADTGDGGNPTYAVTRTIAQPELNIPVTLSEDVLEAKPPNVHENVATLKRGDLLVIGGDLAYPKPSREEYDRRLFLPFELALEPPFSFHRDDISTSKVIMKGVRNHISSMLSLITPPATDHPGIPSYPEEGSPRSEPDSSLSIRELRKTMSSRSTDSSVGMFHIGSSLSLQSNSSKGPTGAKRRPSQQKSDWPEIDEEEEEATSSECGNDSLTGDSSRSRVWNQAPCVYAIPGNHDWFDGLDTFIHCICYRDWLGGWKMPQTKSYFALQLPHGWWFFGFDLALEDDIDGLQYQYFASIADRYIGEHDQIIVSTHEPTWMLDAYLNHPHPEDKPFVKSSKNLKQLIRRHLRGRVALRIAGDIHNYMRDGAEQPLQTQALRSGAAPVLVVAGGGGAFLHPTHTFPARYKETGAYYERQASYPSTSTSEKVGMSNLGQGFRQQNWRFDIIGSTSYFCMVFSFFPRCKLDHIIDAKVYPDGLYAFGGEIWSIFSEVWSDSFASLIAVLFITAVSFFFADVHYGKFRQAMIGLCHATVHLLSAIVLFLCIEIAVEVAIRDGLAGKDYDSFLNTFSAFERRTMPEHWWTSGFMVSILQFMLRAFDLPENMATTRVRICTGAVHAPFSHWTTASTSLYLNATLHSDAGQLTRFDLWSYYISNFLYYSMIASDMASLILGCYLFVCVNFLQLHWNEAFSSVRCQDYKSFVRFHIDERGDLHTYAIGIDRVPRRWREDRKWTSTSKRVSDALRSASYEGLDILDPSIASYGSDCPSRWKSADTKRHGKAQEPRVVDYFCIPRREEKAELTRSKSVVSADWWNAFGMLEKSKRFRKAPTLSKVPSDLKRGAKSQSPGFFRHSRTGINLSDLKRYEEGQVFTRTNSSEL